MEENELISLIYHANFNTIYTHLIKHKIEPWKIKDNRHYSILHIAALDNNTKLINFMI